MNVPISPRSLIHAGACALALALSACQPSPQSESVAGSGTEMGNVIGMIFTPADQPAAGLEVVLYPLDGDTTRLRRTTTNSDGGFGFPSVHGTYRLISLDGKGNGVTVDSIDPVGDARIDLAKRTLAPLGGLSAYVKVGNAQSYKVELRLDGTPFSFLAEPNSGFDWEGIPAGRYWLHAYYSGAKSLDLPITIVAGVTTVLPDSLVMDFNYSFGVSRTDTLVLSSDQLPYSIWDKVYAADEDVDTIYFLLNGKPVAMSPSPLRIPACEIRRDMLNDSGSNLLELRIVLKDTAIARHWFIVLDDGRVTPWPHQAVRAVFLAKEPNPRPDPDGPEMATFRILQRKILAEEDLGYFGWHTDPETDTAMPEEITVPVNVKQGFGFYGCEGPISKGSVITQFPGDTVTLLLRSDTLSRGRAFMLRSGERFEDYAHLRYWSRARWPLADLFPDIYDRLSLLPLSVTPTGLDFRFFADKLIDFNGSPCLPVNLRFSMDSSGTVRENLAVPSGFAAASLLLHYRTDATQGIVSEQMPSRGKYVYIDSSGKGLAGDGTATREFKLDGTETADLESILAAVPSPVSAAWEADYLKENHTASVDSVRYLFTGGRSTVFFLDAQNPEPAKAALFRAVEAWLRGKQLI